MPRFQLLKTVAAPDPAASRSVIDFEAAAPSTVADTDSLDVDLYCGQCGALMLAGIPRRNIRNTVVRCKLCRAYNDPGGVAAQ